MFAAPLVVTAALPACLVTTTSNPPGQQVVTHDHRTDPGSGSGSASGTNISVSHNPPAPPPGVQRNWDVSMKPDGTCQAQAILECKEGMKCNPPMPVAIKCPDGITASETMRVYAQANSWDCYRQIDVQCPKPPATCNPPPPVQTACPGE
jgi:hypothetical protein